MANGMKWAIILSLIGLSLGTVQAELPQLPQNGKSQVRTEWANGKPIKLWLRWIDDKAFIQCFWFDLGQYVGMLPTEWKNLEDVANNVAMKNLFDSVLTDAQKKDCYQTAIPDAWKVAQQTTPIAPPLPPASTWVVAVNGIVLTRPMKNPDFTDMKERAKVGDPCELEIIKTYTTKQSWHFTKSTTGVRGLAVCEVK
jgi:hypothetical protein